MKTPKLPRRRLLRFILFLLIVAGILLWGVHDTHSVSTTRYVIADDNLPAAFSGFRIAHVTDLHDAEFGADNAVLVELVEEAAPDIIIITGDFVDSHRVTVDRSLRFAEKAVELAPTYYVSGNHEALLADAVPSEYRRLMDGLRELGVFVLEDQKLTLERDGEEIALLGLKDPLFTLPSADTSAEIAYASRILESLLEGETRYTVLLSHRPELFDAYVAAGIDIAFCGHAHGGQVRLPFIGGLYAPNQGLFPKYDGGLYQRDKTSMVVSRGLGNSSIPVRINNRPELVLTELRRSEYLKLPRDRSVDWPRGLSCLAAPTARQGPAPDPG